RSPPGRGCASVRRAVRAVVEASGSRSASWRIGVVEDFGQRLTSFLGKPGDALRMDQPRVVGEARGQIKDDLEACLSNFLDGCRTDDLGQVVQLAKLPGIWEGVPHLFSGFRRHSPK